MYQNNRQNKILTRDTYILQHWTEVLNPMVGVNKVAGESQLVSITAEKDTVDYCWYTVDYLYVSESNPVDLCPQYK